MTTPFFQITQEIFDEAIEMIFPYSRDPDKNEEEYYIEIAPLSSKAKSVSFGIDDEENRTTVESGKSPAVVKDTEINDPKNIDFQRGNDPITIAQ